MIKESAIPYSIVHATQFFEFVENIAAAATEGNTARLAPVFIQPMAADDVAKAVGRIAVGTPVNGVVEVAGPEQFRLDLADDIDDDEGASGRDQSGRPRIPVEGCVA